MKTTNVVEPMPLTACSPCLLTIRKLLPKHTSIQAIHTLQPISADIEYCCLEVTLCCKHASVTLSKAFLRHLLNAALHGLPSLHGALTGTRRSSSSVKSSPQWADQTVKQHLHQRLTFASYSGDNDAYRAL